MREVRIVRPHRGVRLKRARARLAGLIERLRAGPTRLPVNALKDPARRGVLSRGAASGAVVLSSFAVVNPLGMASAGSRALAHARALAFAQFAAERQAQAVLHRKLQRLAGVWAPQVEQAAHRARVDPLLVAAVLHTENQGFIDHCAGRVSAAGAIGPMQLRPGTALRQLHVDPWNPRQNIQGGAAYLGHLIRRFGSVRKALAAYNAGPTAVTRGQVNPYAWQYADKVLQFMQKADQVG